MRKYDVGRNLPIFLVNSKKTYEKSQNGYRFITAKNIGIDGFHDEPKEFIPTENYEKIMVRGIPKEGDILFTTEAPLGHIGKIPHFDEPFAVGQRIIVMQPNKSLLDTDYLILLLRSREFQNEVLKHSSGSTVRGIRSKELVQIDISFPPLETQRQIAANLDKATQTIDLCNAILEKLDLLVKARFVEMFGDIIQNTKNWDTREWNEVLNIVNGKNQKAVECKDGKYAICGSGGEIGRASDFLVTENSVIIGRKGNINKPILMREKFWNVDTAFGLVPFTDKVNVEFLFYFCYCFI